MKPIAMVLFAAALAAPAADAPAFAHWSADTMRQWPKTLAPKLNGTKLAVDPIANFGAYSFMALYRTGTGQAEYHATQADVLIVEAGEGTLITGGTIVDAKPTAPHEIRGSGITGGNETRLRPGDIVTVPIKMPHMVKLDAGKHIAYMAVKIGEP